MSVGCFGPTTPPGLPPILDYVIRENPQPGDVVLTGGPHPVGYHRQDPSSRAVDHVDRDEYRWDYLAALAWPDHLPDDSRSTWYKWTQPNITWKNASEYRRDAESLLQTVRVTISNLKSSLVKRNLLTCEESATLLPKFEVTVDDKRKHPAGRLTNPRWTLSDPQQQ
jgi:hypothetical protein